MWIAQESYILKCNECCGINQATCLSLAEVIRVFTGFTVQEGRFENVHITKQNKLFLGPCGLIIFILFKRCYFIITQCFDDFT